MGLCNRPVSSLTSLAGGVESTGVADYFNFD